MAKKPKIEDFEEEIEEEYSFYKSDKEEEPLKEEITFEIIEEVKVEPKISVEPVKEMKNLFTVVLIKPTRMVLKDVSGNNISIPFSKEKHGGLKPGDKINL